MSDITNMTITIEGVWKHGKIVPLNDIDFEKNTKLIINILDKKKDSKSLLKLAGTWKDYDATYNVFKKVYSSREKFLLRR